MRHPTPSRVLRALEAQEAELSNLPSLPDLAIEEYTDDFGIDESSESFPALQAGATGIDRPSSRISHSTPLHKASSAASRLSRSGSAERFAASLQNSRGSIGNRDRKQLDASFEISNVEHTPYQLADLSSLIIDEESGIAAPEFGLPVHPEPDDAALSDVLDSISLTSSSRKTDENDDEQPVSPSGIAKRDFGVNVTRRRPMPRLREDFLNSPVSLSPSPNSSRKVSPPPKSHSPSPEPSSSPIQNPAPDPEDTPETPKRATIERAARSHVLSSSVGLSLASIREESRSYEEGSSEMGDTKTPVPKIYRACSRFSSSSGSEEHSEGEASSASETERRAAAVGNVLSPGGTPSESPPSRLIPGKNVAHIREPSVSDQSSVDSQDITETQDEPTIQASVPMTPHPLRTPRPPSVLRTAYLPATTPADRHKSFLLSLAQSGARPRFANPTPHPHPRRPRLSHPLAQVHSPDRPDGTGDTSFISTASSHDLAVNERANASFDPTTDAAAKFNQVKLNSYLRGLNKHLIEENEALTAELAELRGNTKQGASPRSTSVTSSNGGATSAILMNDLIAALQEELEQTKTQRDEALAAVEELGALRQRHEDRGQDIVRLQREIENAHAETRRRAEIHTNKVKQLSEGADAIVREVQGQLNDALEQVSTLQARLDQGTRKESDRICLAEEQADSARQAKLTAEQARARAESELREISSDRDTLKTNVTKLEQRVETLEEDIEKERKRGNTLAGEATSRVEEEQRRLRVALEAQLAESQSHLAEQNLRVAALEDDLTAAEERAHVARQEATQMEVAIKEAEKKMAADAEELRLMGKKINILVRERDEAESQAAQAKLLSHSQSRKFSGASTLASQYSATSTALSSVHSESIPLEEHQRIVDDLEVELEAAEREIGRLELAIKDTSSSRALGQAKQLRIETLEKENGELNEKVVALRQALQPFADIGNNSTSTPVRTSAPKGTPQTIKRFALLEKTLRTPGAAPFADYTMFQNTTAKDVSGDLSAYLAKFTDLRAELDIADGKYDHAMEELGALGITNVRLVEMVHESRGRIGDLEKEVSELRHSEERVRKRLQRCKCMRCQRRFDASSMMDFVGDTSVSYTESVDISLEDPARSREALQAALEKVNNELSGLKKLWTAERQSLMGEKAMLKDAANKLTAEVKAESAKVEKERRRAKEAARHIQDEGERQKAIMQAELDHAKSSVAALEEDLRQERAKLRSLATQRNKSTREMTDVMLKLEHTETDMAEVRDEIERLRKENKDLEEELRRNGQADHKARRLAAKISENQTVVEELRQERDELTRGYADLQTRYAKISEQTEAVRQQLAKCQTRHDERRHQLDMHVAEIHDLRQTIQEQAAELQGTEDERKRMAADRVLVAQTIAALEADLHKVRREAEKIRRDVKQLREERAQLQARSNDDKALTERSQAQIRQLSEDIGSLQEKLRRHEDAESNHICAADEQALVQMQQLHREHCQSFMRRIRYLKVRVTRESAFRSDLAYQKRHLLGTIACFEKTEKNLLVTVARLGFPQPSQPRRRKKPTFKSAVLAVMFLCRTQTSSIKWRRARTDRDAVLAGYELARGHPLRT